MKRDRGKILLAFTAREDNEVEETAAQNVLRAVTETDSSASGRWAMLTWSASSNYGVLYAGRLTRGLSSSCAACATPAGRWPTRLTATWRVWSVLCRSETSASSVTSQSTTDTGASASGSCSPPGP